MDVNPWDGLAEQSGPPGGQAQAQIRAFQMMTAAIDRFNRASRRQGNVMIGLTVAILVLTCALLWLGYLQYQVSGPFVSRVSSGSGPFNQETVLTCSYADRIRSFRDVYALDEATKGVRLLSIDPPRSGGSLEVSESGYRLVFPES